MKVRVTMDIELPDGYDIEDVEDMTVDEIY